MTKASFPYVALGGGPHRVVPLLPLTLKLGALEIDVHGLVDSGSNINVLPFTLGTRLGGDWDQYPHTIQVSGSLGTLQGKVFVAQAVIAGLPKVPLIFAWVQSDTVPLILGQYNFFHEFDVCFFRAQSFFELTHRP